MWVGAAVLGFVALTTTYAHYARHEGSKPISMVWGGLRIRYAQGELAIGSLSQGFRPSEFVGTSLPVVRADRRGQDRAEDDHRPDMRFIGKVRLLPTAVLEDEEWTLRESLMTPP